MKIKQHLGFISMLAIAFTACQQKPAETDNFLENEIKTSKLNTLCRLT